jgi:hypothetical protein
MASMISPSLILGVSTIHEQQGYILGARTSKWTLRRKLSLPIDRPQSGPNSLPGLKGTSRLPKWHVTPRDDKFRERESEPAEATIAQLTPAA